ncbi:septation protein sun4 [Ophiostoma piceae UAMH 11346]|uniref:Septation protein sun4 n=1 Tax=Ophiostoma piceae (strain UAMH 11346) TaxID=1262450 RepID=S3CEX6_OPHP1|nr:septation protein sun4 [Ophiostoma piceae UAMH 11346]
MKGFVQIAVTAAMAAGAAAEHNHGHMHRHRALNVEHQQAKREAAAPVEVPARVGKRAAASVATANVPVETKYVYSDGEAVDLDEAKQCIADGECIVVGTSTPTSTAIPTATKHAAEFFESKSSSTVPSTTSTTSSSSTSTSSTSTSSTSTSSSFSSTSTSTSSTSTSSSSTSSAAATSSAAVSSGSGTDFPNGKIPCSTFPSEYGAVALDWLDLDGWASIQTTGSWTVGTLISYIEQAITGGCVKNSFCSYACAPGQSKAQWPTTSQGATGQSIGGLWCNADGYLERTNPHFTTLCQDGLGGITIKNELEEQSCVCGTNYPGDEKMSIPLVTKPGGEYTLTNINAATAYQWQGKYTSGQFYVNNQGVALDQACVWDSSDYPESAGNWAPVNIGAGTDINGVTYISIFPNTPTTTAKLDFDIVISGDINGDCYLKGGVYYGGSSGCTTALKSGGSAVITFKPYGTA